MIVFIPAILFYIFYYSLNLLSFVELTNLLSCCSSLEIIHFIFILHLDIKILTPILCIFSLKV